MPAPYADRVQETTTTAGTGTVTLAGAVAGYQTFQSAFTVGRRVAYAITDGTAWEVGWGTLVTTTTLSRDLVLTSSNANALVSLSGGSSNIFCSHPAESIADKGLGVMFTMHGVYP